MDTECVLCDWQMDLLAPAQCTYRPGQNLPLTWRDDTVTEVLLSDGIAGSMPGVALVAHWATDHPEQLRGLIGEFEVSGPRWLHGPVS